VREDIYLATRGEFFIATDTPLELTRAEALVLFDWLQNLEGAGDDVGVGPSFQEPTAPVSTNGCSRPAPRSEPTTAHSGRPLGDRAHEMRGTSSGEGGNCAGWGRQLPSQSKTKPMVRLGSWPIAAQVEVVATHETAPKPSPLGMSGAGACAHGPARPVSTSDLAFLVRYWPTAMQLS